MLGKRLGSLILLFTLLMSACAPPPAPTAAPAKPATEPAKPAASPAAAPSASPAAAAPAARAGGKLTVYSALNESTNNAFVDAFKKSTPGVEVEVLPLAAAGELQTRIRTEKASPRASS